MILRDYQKECSGSIFSEWDNEDSTLAVLPTGTGKTIIIADVIRKAFPRRAMFLAHRQELIYQACDKIRRTTGLTTGIEMGDQRTDIGGAFRMSVVVSTIQTLGSGGDGGGRMGKFDPMKFGILIIDEAHHATSPSYRRVIDYYRSNPKLKVLGVTATPDRGDEEALGQVFKTVAFDYEILDAIRDGWLVPIEQQMVTINGLDFSSVRTTAGDLNSADLAAVMEAEKVLHGVVGSTIDIIGSKRALVFTASVKHAEMASEIFNRHKSGMSEWVCGGTDTDKRKLINQKFDSSEIQVLCNCGTHTEGYDSPGIEVIVMARPTKSRSLYAQMIGRSTRALPGVVDGHGLDTPDLRKASIANSPKPSCLVIDFVGNSGKHKLMTTADILGGKVSDVAIESAIIRAKNSSKPVRMDTLLEEEEAAQKERDVRRILEEARRMRLRAKVSFSQTTIDPFNILQIQPVKQRGWDQGKVLSEKQRNFMRKSGINPDSMNYSAAKQLIGELITRFDKHLCTLNQAKVLKKFGYRTDMTFQEASQTIDAVAKNGWKTIATPQSIPRVLTQDGDIPF